MSLLVSGLFAAACDVEAGPDSPRGFGDEDFATEADDDTDRDTPQATEVAPESTLCHDFDDGDAFVLAEGEDAARLFGFDGALPPLDNGLELTTPDSSTHAAPIGPLPGGPGLDPGGVAPSCYYKLKCNHNGLFLTCWLEYCCNWPTGVVCDRVSP